MTQKFKNHFTTNPRISLLTIVGFKQPCFFCGVVRRYLPGLKTNQELHTRIVNWQVRIIVGYRFYKTVN